MRRLVLHMFIAMSFLVPNAHAFGLVMFPDAAKTPEGAIRSFDARAETIINYVACGREMTYYSAREALRDDGDYDPENILSVLVGKMAWLIRHGSETCKATIGDNDEGLTALAILGAKLKDAASSSPKVLPPVPTPCAKGTLTGVPKARTFTFEVDEACLRAQINDALAAMTKRGHAGSSDLPCIASSNFPFVMSTVEGEWDVALRDLTRILYMNAHHGILEAPTITHMWEELLSLQGGPFEPADFPLIDLCGVERAGDHLGTPEERLDREYWYREALGSLADFLKWFAEYRAKTAAIYALSTTGIGALPFAFAIGPGGDPVAALSFRIRETENHILQIESAKYLINQKLIEIEADHDNIEEIRHDQAALQGWILRKLQTIANSDFEEYNARPYTRYSLNAIANLFEYTTDDDPIKKASRIVLDLSAAKFAAGSSLGRRIVPFRRLADVDIGSSLYPIAGGADHEVARAIVFTGQTDLLAHQVPGLNGIDGAGLPAMIYAAVGTYRWPIQVLETAIATPDRPPFLQHIGHEGIESYYATSSFTMSLGGIKTPPGQSILGHTHKNNDRGAVVPSMIAPTIAGTRPEEVFRILGTGSEHRRGMNLCGYKGFICGLNPRAPTGFYQACSTRPEGVGPGIVTFFASKDCFPALDGPHFYAAVLDAPCTSFCNRNERWGLIEVVPAPHAVATETSGWPRFDPEFEQFKSSRRSALLAAVPGDDGSGTYVNQSGDRIEFAIGVEPFGSMTTLVNGAAPIPGVVFLKDQNGLPIGVTPGYTDGDIIWRESTPTGPISYIGSPLFRTRPIEIDFRDWANPKITE